MAYPEQRWDVIHIDFITDLKPTAEGFDTILTCTDRLTRFTYLIATKKKAQRPSSLIHGFIQLTQWGSESGV